MGEITFEMLKGKTLISIQGKEGSDEIIFIGEGGDKYKLYHGQNCCESVVIEDICGDLCDLIGAPILLAEEVIHYCENPDGVPTKDYQDSWTWTFYKLSTIKGSVTIRWYGESNGYYSESVDFCHLNKEPF
jgi:hypothetical protein